MFHVNQNHRIFTLMYFHLTESNELYKTIINDLDLVKKRLSKLERVYNVIKKNSSFDQTVGYIFIDPSYR